MFIPPMRNWTHNPLPTIKYQEIDELFYLSEINSFNSSFFNLVKLEVNGLFKEKHLALLVKENFYLKDTQSILIKGDICILNVNTLLPKNILHFDDINISNITNNNEFKDFISEIQKEKTKGLLDKIRDKFKLSNNNKNKY